MEKYTKEGCILLLRKKAGELRDRGEDRYLKRSDFTDGEVNAIKSFLGPWPRALEEAGLKDKRGDDRREKNREKRILAKRRRREAEKSRQVNENQPSFHTDGHILQHKEITP